MTGVLAVLVVFALTWLAFPAAVALDARGRGAGTVRWSAFALVTGPLGLVIYVTAANRTTSDGSTVDRSQASGYGPY